MKRRESMIVIFLMTLVLVVVAQVTPVPLVQAQQQFTDWGWPLPYEKVSDKSISYLKEKGWWPLKWAYQPPWMAEATIPWIIKKMDLAKKRGLELEIVGLLAGPDSEGSTACKAVASVCRLQVGFTRCRLWRSHRHGPAPFCPASRYTER